MTKDYGLVSDWQVEFDEEVFEMQGVPRNGAAFHQVLTRRAAHLLWYTLTKSLFMGEAPPMTSAAGTAPLALHDDPHVTMRVDVREVHDDLYEMRGVTRASTWLAQVSSADIQWLWAMLDVHLYPVGWEGRGAAYA